MHAVITKRNKPVTSTRWTGKWSNGVPTPTTNAYIDTDYTTATGSFACRDLIVTASAVLTIPENTYVKVLKDINQTTTSHIIVKAGGELMLLNTDADVTTARLTAEATYKNLQRSDYAFICSPISNIPLKKLSLATLDNRFYKYNEKENFFDNRLDPNIVTTIPGEGYHIRTPANHSLLPANFNVSINNLSGGSINSGIIKINIYRDNFGYNLIGNPYNAKISLRKFYEANKHVISYIFNIWKKTNGAQGNSYISFNSLVNNSENSSQNVQAFQSFVIQLREGFNNVKVIFTPDMIIPYVDFSIADRFYLNFFQKNINLHIGSLCYDIKKYNSIFENINITPISIIDNSNDRGIFQQREFTINTKINIKFKVSETSEYSLRLKDISGLFLGLPTINLYDALTGIIHNLKNSDYTFASEAGTFDNRFSISFQ